MYIKTILPIVVIMACILQSFSAAARQTAGEKKDTIPPALAGSLPVAKEVKNELKNAGKVLEAAQQQMQQVAGKIKLLFKGKLVDVKRVNVQADYLQGRDTTGAMLGGYSGLRSRGDYSIGMGLSLKDVPFVLGADGNQGFYNLQQPPLQDIYKFNFDVNAYQELLRRQVLSQISSEKVLGMLQTKIDDVRRKYETGLLKELTKISDEFEQNTGASFAFSGNEIKLSGTDEQKIKGVLFAGINPDKRKAAIARYEAMTKLPGDTSVELKSVLAEIQRYESAEKMFKVYKEWKGRLETNKEYQELQSHLPFTPANFKRYLQDPNNLREVIRSHASLSAFQQLFMGLTKLDMGQNAVESGKFGVNSLLNKGVNASFAGRRAGAGLLLGKNDHINQWMQGGLNSIVTNEYSGLTGVSAGNNGKGAGQHSLSVNFFNFMSSPLSSRQEGLSQAAYLPNAPRQDAVITYNSTYNIGAIHKVKLSISKSIGTYRNMINADSSVNRKTAASQLLGNEGYSNYAANLDYSGTLLNTGVDASFSKVGLGYSNPGSFGLPRGETRGSLSFYRKIYKQRLQLKYSTDLRVQHFDPGKKYTYQAFSNKLQASLRLKKNTRASLLFQQSNYISELGMTSDKGNNFLAQATGSFQFKIGEKRAFNTTVLNWQKMRTPVFMEVYYRSNSVFFMNSSSLFLGKNAVTLNLSANHSSSSDYLFNTSFMTAEANYQYQAGTQLTMTSGMGYYDNSGWNRQVGFHQQVSAVLMKKWNIGVGADYKKAVKVFRADLANQLFVTASIQYSL